METHKKYLVTGAAGMIGSRFVSSCKVSETEMISVDHKDLFLQRSEIQNYPFGTIVDLDILFTWLRKKKPALTAIVHMGAITDTRETNLALLKRYNLEYSQTLWNYAAQNKIPFIYASSAATYGEGKQGYDDNEDIISHLKPLNAYGKSKQEFDLWALEEEKKGNHPPNWSGFKFFNVYGYGERHKNFMSSVVLHAYDEIKKSGKVTLFKSHKEGIADGHQKRDFVSVEDVVKVLHFAIQKPIKRGIYNLGTGEARTFLALAQAVFKALGKLPQIEFIDTPEIIRSKYQYFTEAKMHRLRNQGYEEDMLSLEEGVDRYVKKLIQYDQGAGKA